MLTLLIFFINCCFCFQKWFLSIDVHNISMGEQKTRHENSHYRSSRLLGSTLPKLCSTYLKASGSNYSFFLFIAIILLVFSMVECWIVQIIWPVIGYRKSCPLEFINTADVYRRREDVCQIYNKYSFSRVIFTSSVSDYYSQASFLNILNQPSLIIHR